MSIKLNTPHAKSIYMALLDYYIICGDPLYRTLCKFAKKINSIPDPSDRKALIEYFEQEERKPISYFKNPNA